MDASTPVPSLSTESALKQVPVLNRTRLTLVESPLPQTVYQSFVSGLWTGLLWACIFVIFLWLVQVFRTRSTPIAPLCCTSPATLAAQQQAAVSRNPVASQLSQDEPSEPTP